MFINKIYVDKYKKLSNLTIVFKEENTKELEDRNLNFSVVVGENGTGKTTLFQLICSIFMNNFNDEDSTEYKLEYIMNNKLFKFSDHGSIPEQIPSKLIISSYTPIDKLKIKTKNMFSEVEIIKSKIDDSMIRNAANVITKNYLNNNLNSINHLVNYIGYLPNSYYIEINRNFKNSISYYSRIFRNSNLGDLDDIFADETKDFTDTSLSDSIRRKVYYYQEKLLECNYRPKITIKFTERFYERIGKNKTSNSIDLDEYYFQRIYLEVMYIVEKIRLIEYQHSELQSSKYKKRRQRLINLNFFENYIEGPHALLNDIKFLEKLGIPIFSDTWFVQGNELIPLSMWSSGELSLFLRLLELHESVSANSIVLIDEPETHLHPRWIRGYINTLKILLGDRKCHIIIATHSPLIVSDIQTRAIVALKKHDSKIIQHEISEETLGLNYEMVLNEVFGIENSNGEVLNEYIEKIEILLDKRRYHEAYELYSKLADSQEKFELFIKLKKYKEEKMDV